MSRRRAAYAEALLRRRSPGARYLHLGHWDGPADRDLEAAQRRLDDAVLDLAAMGDGLAVLDVGCGVGGTLANAAARWRGLRAVGLNTDPRQLAVAEALDLPGDARVRWLEGDACRMPLPDRCVDRVISIEAAFHFASRRAFMAEARRVLRPGGVIALSDIVSTPSIAELRGPLGFALECVIDRGIGPWPALWEPVDWGALAGEIGLELLHLRDASAATLPSYDCFQSQRAEPGSAPGLDDMSRAVALLRWLHERGHVRVIYAAMRLTR